jgi:hypothetical protein
MRALPVLIVVLFATPSFAGLGSLLKAVSKVDDVGKAAGRAATHVDDVGHAAKAASHADNARFLDDAAHAKDGEGLGQKLGETAIDVAGGAAGAAGDDGEKPEPIDLHSLEMSKHQARMAKINALEAVYNETHDATLLEKITRIRSKELARHAKKIDQLAGTKR